MENSFKYGISNFRRKTCFLQLHIFKTKRYALLTLDFGVRKLIFYLIFTNNCIFVHKLHEFQFNDYINKNNRGHLNFSIALKSYAK